MRGLECLVCPVFRDLCARLDSLPFYAEVRIPKTAVQKMPRCFEETVLGEPKGSLKQYRGPNASHVLEYATERVAHRDKVDPRFDAIGHIVNDAPYVIVGGLVLVATALFLIAVFGGDSGD